MGNKKVLVQQGDEVYSTATSASICSGFKSDIFAKLLLSFLLWVGLLPEIHHLCQAVQKQNCVPCEAQSA